MPVQGQCCRQPAGLFGSILSGPRCRQPAGSLFTISGAARFPLSGSLFMVRLSRLFRVSLARW